MEGAPESCAETGRPEDYHQRLEALIKTFQLTNGLAGHIIEIDMSKISRNIISIIIIKPLMRKR